MECASHALADCLGGPLIPAGSVQTQAMGRGTWLENVLGRLQASVIASQAEVQVSLPARAKGRGWWC